MGRLCLLWPLLAVALLLGVGTPTPLGAEDPPTIAPFQTARVRIEGTVSAQGQVLPIQGEGEINATTGASRLTIAALGAAFETIVVDGRTYTRNTLTGRWEYSEGTQAGGFNPARLTPYDPATIRAAGSNWTRVGPAAVDGIATTQWRADTNLGTLLGLGVPAASAAGLGGDATMTVWLDDSNQRLRRLKVETVASGGATATPTLATAGQVLTLTFDRFDVEVVIIAPAGAVPATPGILGGAGALPSAAATRVATAGPTAEPPRPIPDTPATMRSSPNSLLIVRLLGVVSLTSVAIAGLVVARHRRNRAAPPSQNDADRVQSPD